MWSLYGLGSNPPSLLGSFFLRTISMQLLANQLAPVASTHGFGIEVLETASYVLQAYRSKTGVQFFVTADPQSENLAAFLVRPLANSSPCCPDSLFFSRVRGSKMYLSLALGSLTTLYSRSARTLRGLFCGCIS